MGMSYWKVYGIMQIVVLLLMIFTDRDKRAL